MGYRKRGGGRKGRRYGIGQRIGHGTREEEEKIEDMIQDRGGRKWRYWLLVHHNPE